MDEIENNLRSFKEMEKQNATVQEERRMERMMMEIQSHHMKKKEEDKAIKPDCNVLEVKLPKLVITRFSSNHINWFRFWNQFESETDRSELPAVSKFRLGLLTMGFPLQMNVTLGQKNILISKYGKSSEVANAHIQNIMSLAYINSVNLHKIHEFTEKLLGSAQALETMGKRKKSTDI